MTSCSVNTPVGAGFSVGLFVSKEMDPTWKTQEEPHCHASVSVRNHKTLMPVSEPHCTSTVSKTKPTTKPHRQLTKYNLSYLPPCIPPQARLSRCCHTSPAPANTEWSFSWALNSLFIANPLIQFCNFPRLTEAAKVSWKVAASAPPLPAVCVEHDHSSRQSTRTQHPAEYTKAQENEC